MLTQTAKNMPCLHLEFYNSPAYLPALVGAKETGMPKDL
jgi:hypothetical protein